MTAGSHACRDAPEVILRRGEPAEPDDDVVSLGHLFVQRYRERASRTWHEITPENLPQHLAMLSTLGTLRITNVRVISADGGDGHAAGAPYDRVAFTAGTYDLPEAFHEQIKVGGLLLAVIKNEGGGDNVFLLRKNVDHFESCGCIPSAAR